MSKEALFKSVFATTLGVAALLCGALIYFGYQAYTNPSQVYGSWIEINAPGYRTEVLTLSDQGVFRNHRLISTSFEYSPQLKRIQPASPIQRFIKQGFEDN